jgi:mono/diheme cytochrome c family protein
MTMQKNSSSRTNSSNFSFGCPILRAVLSRVGWERALPLLCVLFVATILLHGQSQDPGKDFGKYDKWKKHVSTSESARQNPRANNPQAAAAGAQIFSEDCARCHGRDAAGHRGKPTLRGPDVISATDGQLFWIIKNGNLAQNMPAFPQIPDAERWQIVAYLRSLTPLTTTTAKPAAAAEPGSAPKP